MTEKRQVHPDEIHLPGPSYWPILVAFSLLVMAVGIIFSILVSIAGVIGLVICIIGWVLENRSTPEVEYDLEAQEGTYE